jgi:putative endonuclease
MYYCYVLRNAQNPDEFYTGSTQDLRRRLTEHNAGRQKATSGRQWEVAYYEAYQSERVARDRERTIKRNGRMRMLLMNRIKSQWQSD